MAQLAITAIGADQPGIVARVTGVLARRGANLDDTSMTILGGHFAMMLLVDLDDPAGIEGDLLAATEELGLVVTARAVGPGHASAPPTHVLSVYGTDRPGLVASASQVLAERMVNVTDLTTRVLDGAQHVYTMLFEIALPPGVTPEAIEEELRAAIAGVDVTLRPLDAEIF